MMDSIWAIVASPSAAIFFAALSAVGAAWAAFETRQATRAQLVSTLIDEYAKQEMANHLTLLDQFRKMNTDDFARKWKDSLDRNESEAVRVNNARRHVKGFFVKSAQLYEGGFLNWKAFKLVAYRAGINVYFDVVRPLDEVLNSTDTQGKSTEESLKRYVGRYRGWD